MAGKMQIIEKIDRDSSEDLNGSTLRVVDSFLKEVCETLRSGEPVDLDGFGQFQQSVRLVVEFRPGPDLAAER
jgi:nucleoid DNA-binding protein